MGKLTKNQLKARLVQYENLVDEAVKLRVKIQELITQMQDLDDFDALYDIMESSPEMMANEVYEALEKEGYLDEMEEGDAVIPYPTLSIMEAYPRHAKLNITLADGSKMHAAAGESDFGTMQASITATDVTPDGAECDIVLVEQKRGELATIQGYPEDNRKLDAYVYGDPEDEDWTAHFTLDYTAGRE